MKPAAISLLVFLWFPPAAQCEDLLQQVKEARQLIQNTEYQKGLAACFRIAEKAKQNHNEAALAEAYYEIADAQYYLGNREELKHYVEEALKIFRKLNDIAGVSRCYYSIAYYYERNEPEKMIALLEQARKYADQAKDASLQTVIENAMGTALQNLGQYRLAAAHFETSARIAEREKNDHRLAIALANVGLNHSNLGDYPAALIYFDRALALSRKTKDKRALAVVLSHEGQVYLTLGNTDEALSCFEECLRLDEESGYKSGQLKQLLNLADVYDQLGEEEKYLAYLRKALVLSEQTNDIFLMVITLNNLAEALITDKRFEEADTYLQQAETLSSGIHRPFLLGRTKLTRSLLDLKRGALAAVQEDIDSARDDYNSIDDAYAFAILWSRQAQLFELQHKIPEAIDALKRAVALHETTHSVRNLPEWCRKIAELNAGAGHNEEAGRYFDQSLSYVDKLDSLLVMDRFRINLFREVSGIYHSYALWLVGQERTERAWEILEQGRARALKFRMAQALESTSLSEAERDWLGQLSSLQRTLREEELTRKEREAVLTKISLAESRYEQASFQAARTRATIPGKDSLRFPTTSNLLIIEYALCNDELLVFSHGQSGTRFRKISPATPVLLKARQFQQQASLYQHPLQSETLGRDLYHLLVEPELSKESLARIVLIPDDLLWTLPFSALTSGDGKYLAEKYAVSMVPSMQTLERLQARPSSFQKSAIAFANTSFPDTQKSPIPLPPLPAAGKEAEMVAKRIHGSELHMNPTESALKQTDYSRYSIIHFATHTLIDEVHPERSCVVIGADSKEDGYLQAREIYRMKIPADMIVLSGCRSGTGATIEGEGLMGLSHALFAAGAKIVVSTLWEISDEGAMEFMDSFYKSLRNQTIVNALQSAQLEMIHSRKWKHSGYWAGFVVIGDADQKLDLPGSSSNLFIPIALAIVILFSFLVFRRARSSNV